VGPGLLSWCPVRAGPRCALKAACRNFSSGALCCLAVGSWVTRAVLHAELMADKAGAGKAALDTNPTAADVKALPKATDEMDYVLDAMNGECLSRSRHSDWAPVGHRAHWPAPGRRP